MQSTTIIASGTASVRVAGTFPLFLVVVDRILDFWSVSGAHHGEGSAKRRLDTGGRSLVANTGREQAGQKEHHRTLPFLSQPKKQVSRATQKFAQTLSFPRQINLINHLSKREKETEREREQWNVGCAFCGLAWGVRQIRRGSRRRLGLL